MEGWLWKKGQGIAVAGSYKRRWFKLQILVSSAKKGKGKGTSTQRLALTYFKKPEYVALGQKKLLGAVDLSKATRLEHTDPSEHSSDKVSHCVDFGFHAVTPERTWYLLPETADELRRWVHKLASVLPPGVVDKALVEHALNVDGAATAKLHDASEGVGVGAEAKSGGDDTKEREATDSDDDSTDHHGAAGDEAKHGPTPLTGGESAHSTGGSGDEGLGAGARAGARDSAGLRDRRTQRARPGGKGKARGTGVDSTAMQRELDAAYLRIAELERRNRELTERVEMRNVDRSQVLALEDPLLASFGLGKKNDKRAGARAGKIRRGTGTEDDWEDNDGCKCSIM